MAKKKDSKPEFLSFLGNEKGRRGIMFLLSIIFFATLVVMVRSGGTQIKNPSTGKPNTGGSQQESEKVTAFSFLKKENYMYTYIFELNTEKEMVSGKKYGDKEKFTIINNKQNIEGGRLQEQYLVKENTQYIFSELPSKNLRFTKKEFLEELVELAAGFEEKKGYTIYTIDPIDLMDILDPDVTYDPFGEYDDDSLEVYIDDEQVTKIVFNLNNYVQNTIGDKTKTFKITLEYTNIGNVEDFELK